MCVYVCVCVRVCVCVCVCACTVSNMRYILALLFAIELAMRLCAYGCREFFCGEDWLWSLLDAFIVLSSIWDIVLDVLFLWDASDNPVSTLRAIRILRLARIVKAVRLMRVFRFVRALRTLISSIFHTLKSLFWALVLMVLILYVFGASATIRDLREKHPQT